MQGVGGGGYGGGGIGGAPYKKMGVKKMFLYSARCYGGVGSGGPKGPPGGQRPPALTQELEVGAHRAPYLLVFNTETFRAYDPLF